LNGLRYNRIAKWVRQLRTRAAEFRLAALAADLLSLLPAARALLAAGPSRPPGSAGPGRVYRPLPALRLAGLFTVPAVGAEGCGGVVAWLLDAGGSVDRRGPAPGASTAALAAYREPITAKRRRASPTICSSEDFPLLLPSQPYAEPVALTRAG
jgi:hypothetical protein